MKNILSHSQYIKESKYDYEVYHDTYSSAIDEVESYAKQRGYEIDQNEYENTYTLLSKPDKGYTKSDTLTIYKDDKEQRKALQVQIYRMDDGKFELNMYIN